jgi:crossover junction endodeoxyribonuclease RuvC
LCRHGRGGLNWGHEKLAEKLAFVAQWARMLAIGIDPGTRNLGWGVVCSEGNRLSHVGHGVIRMSGDDELSKRLLGIGEQLTRILDDFRPEVGSVEGIFFDKNAQSAAKLGHARGVVLFCLERANVAVREHSPARVKRTLTGNGNAEKAQVGRMVQAILRLEVAPPVDASDALAIAITELRADPRIHVLDARRRAAARKKMPPHLAEAIARAKSRA